MGAEILLKINNNYQMAISAHRELADVFWFISLPGYAVWNEYQLIDEQKTQREVKKYITETYHIFLPDALPSDANISMPLLQNENRKNLKGEKIKEITKTAFASYQKWEEDTLELYQNLAINLIDSGEVSAFNFVGDIIKDVKEELTNVTNKMIEFESHNWDMPTISAEQPDYFEKYQHLIGRIYFDQKMHHWNSALASGAKI